jgi:hypothetical protein
MYFLHPKINTHLIYYRVNFLRFDQNIYRKGLMLIICNKHYSIDHECTFVTNFFFNLETQILILLICGVRVGRSNLPLRKRP